MSMIEEEAFRRLITFTADGSMPIYEQIALHFRQLILSGRFQDRTRLPSESVMSKILGVNHLTLRKSLQVLADQKLIMQRQGKGTFITLGHQSSVRRIGIIVSSLNYQHDLYTMRQLVSVMRNLQALGGCEAILLEGDSSEGHPLIEQVNRHRCDGLLVLNCSPSYLEQLLSSSFSHVPMVFVNIHDKLLVHSSAQRVEIQENIITRGMDYLTGLGHRRILYISIEHPNNLSLQHRNQEFLEYPLAGKLSAILPFSSHWYRISNEIISHYCSQPDPPTAVLTAGISFAFGAWNGILEAGLTIPDDMSLVGIDGNPNVNPTLTTFDQPMEEMIGKALELLDTMMVTGKSNRKRLFQYDSQLMERGSTAPPR